MDTRDYLEPWLVETDEGNHGQVVSLEVHCWTSMAGFKNDKVLAAGKFSVSV